MISMSELESMENELDPRLQQMLKAYAVTLERDPASARRNQERFVQILNTIFDDPTPPKPAIGWFGFRTWPSIFNQLREFSANSIVMPAILAGLILVIVLVVFLFGSVGMTVYAANSSLPGDALYPLKTAIESIRVGLTADPANQARMYTEFAGRRLSEIQSLIVEGRYNYIAQASNGFERDIQRAVSTIESLSQTDPVRAVAARAEIVAILRGYPGLLNQMLVSLPGDVQPAIQNAINASQSAVELLDFEDDINDDEDDVTDATPSPQPSNMPQLTSTSLPSPEASETLQVSGISTALPLPSQPPQATATPIPPATQGGSGPVSPGGDGTCQGALGAVTVENLEVPQGASCTLDGTRVQGNIFVRNGASLTARGVTVIGNIQAEGASFVEVLAGSMVGGSIQLKQGGSARVENVSINGDIQFESNNGVLSAAGNQVGGNIQAFQNVGGITIANNFVNGNLQCKENNSAPSGDNNTVQGNKEDQCAAL
jgi:hypothetical protein